MKAIDCAPTELIHFKLARHSNGRENFFIVRLTDLTRFVMLLRYPLQCARRRRLLSLYFYSLRFGNFPSQSELPRTKNNKKKSLRPQSAKQSD
jgi:hypothetical protein